MLPQPPRHDPALSLKSLPPRAARGFIERERLCLERLQVGGAQAFALLAPAGFGKTAQLVQWRRESLARGALVLWFTADGHDEPLRFVQGLVHAAREACGRRGFDDDCLARIARCADAQEAATLWLAEVAQLSVDVLLILDDLELLPSATRAEVLVYLLGNAPPNLCTAMAARSSAALLEGEALGPAAITRITAADLRMRLDETLALLSAAPHVRCDADSGVRLHELTEGWPLGVQLAIGALTRGGDLEHLLAAASSDIQRYFVDAIIDRQSARATRLLVRLARFDPIHPQLCADVMDDPACGDELLRLHHETPLLLRAEGESWMRLHPLAREVLGERLAQLPAPQLELLSRRAMDWYARHGLYEAAAEQAFQAGDMVQALALIERSTGPMTVQGRSNAVLSWYERLPTEALHERPAFWGPAAWALAMSDRHAQAQPLIELILAQQRITPGQRFEAILVGVTAASFADHADECARLLQAWPEPPPDVSPGLLPIHADASAHLTMLRGEPAQARLLYANIGRLDRLQSYSPVSYGFAGFGMGAAWLWEGRPARAEEHLRPALARAEERMGRHHPLSCMTAALLAQARWQMGDEEEPQALLAGRLETLVHFGMPEAQMGAYLTLAGIAESQGHEGQALALLDTLRALGRRCGMVRPRVLAKAELARLHARHRRVEMARAMLAELVALLNRSGDVPPVFVPWIALQTELARAYVLLAEPHELARALKSCEAAAQHAAVLGRGGDLIEARLLQARCLEHQDPVQFQSLRREALSLARAEGLLRLAQSHDDAPAASVPASAVQTRPVIAGLQQASGLLTGKEREVLILLGRSLSNKEIAMALGVGEQTIKWHVKNLFQKLGAASRRHAVARARLQGIIPYS